MAVQNGILTGAEAQKLYSYPVLSASANDYLKGDGTWAVIDEATTTQGGFMPASDKAFLEALLSGALANPTTNATTGALEYVYSDTVLFSIPVASGT